jgi:hypothetical protein
MKVLDGEGLTLCLFGSGVESAGLETIEVVLLGIAIE